MEDIFQSYLIVLGWAVVGAVSTGLGIAIALKIFELSTGKIGVWELIKEGNVPMAIVLAAVILALGIVVAAAIRP